MTRLGRWIDFENDYKTMDPSFMESVWWVFSQLWAKGLVYKGFKVRIDLFSSLACNPGRFWWRAASSPRPLFLPACAAEPAADVAIGKAPLRAT